MTNAIIFDTETTGINDPQLIEAAYIRPDSFANGIKESFCKRYKPSKAISLGAMATHHIMDEDLEGCEASESFLLPDGVEYLIGHNIDFDWKVIGQPPIKRICTLALCRHLIPEADSHSLGAMIYYFNRGGAREMVKGAHSAEADVMMCLFILHAIINLTNADSWEYLWQLSEKARIPTVMPYGKHKGEPIASVPSDYKQWLLRQTDVDPYLVKALRGETA